ncbi:MAG: 23S rRNA (uracil(1939)-C(5))-methyltransferase RlmD [Planctomycetota bacterium JB042]
MKPGTELTLRIDRLADKGRSAGRSDGREVHVPFAVPGDEVRVAILGKRKRRLEARLLELVEPSPLRDDPRCRYFGSCGGCTRQNVRYAAQLDLKREAIERTFFDAGLLAHAEVRPTLGAEEIYDYRNKMEFSFGARRWLTEAEVESGEAFDRDFALGLHVPGHFDRLLDLEECHLQGEVSRRIVNGLRALAKEQGWPPWNVRRAEGFLRHVVIRTPAREAEVLVDLVTFAHDPERMETVAARLRRDVPEVTTLVNTVNDGVAQVAHGSESHVVFGDGVVHDRIGPFRFEIAAHAFFQTNTRQAERLYEVAREFAALRESDVAYDLYCGLGTITLFMARDVRHVLGVEIDPVTTACARRNAAANGVENVSFEAGDLLEVIDAPLVERTGAPDVVLVDPPRAGIHPKMVRKIDLLGAERLVYVSCNPKTQAKDLEALKRSYDVTAIQPVDLFPHTDHVENVVALRRR